MSLKPKSQVREWFTGGDRDRPTWDYKILDGDDFDRGVVEAVQQTAMNNSQAVVGLARLLVRHGVLTEDEVVEMLSAAGSG